MINVSNYFFVILFAVCLTVSCGDEDGNGDGYSNGRGDGPGTSSETYKYEFSRTVNGVKCTTGKQKFSSKSALCNALNNTRLNDGCACKSRKTYFEQMNCRGTFDEVCPRGW